MPRCRRSGRSLRLVQVLSFRLRMVKFRACILRKNTWQKVIILLYLAMIVYMERPDATTCT